eukprot:GHRQ01036428.1.p2 GENE.GHRQ01036428.1~~GHRQ01036428.1.p2  ORF type:complete len:103 (+),score=66.01 GHRQ01036428.1:294-602(+)
MENNLLGAQQETRCRVEELEGRVSKLHKKLDVLIKLFISSLGPSGALSMGAAAGAAHDVTAPGAFAPRTGGMAGSNTAPSWTAGAAASAASEAAAAAAAAAR